MEILLSALFLSTSVEATGSVCQVGGSRSSSTIGCVSSTFLHVDNDRLVKVSVFLKKGLDIRLFVDWWRRRCFHVSSRLPGRPLHGEQPGHRRQVQLDRVLI